MVDFQLQQKLDEAIFIEDLDLAVELVRQGNYDKDFFPSFLKSYPHLNQVVFELRSLQNIQLDNYEKDICFLKVKTFVETDISEYFIHLLIYQLHLKRKKCIIFGTGSSCERLLNEIISSEIVDYFIDNDVNKQNKMFHGKPIYSPEHLNSEDKNQIFIIIASQFYNEISEQLTTFGFKWLIHYHGCLKGFQINKLTDIRYRNINQRFKVINKGFCCCCDSDVTFYSESNWLRDNYLCSNCGSIPRERAIMHCIEKFFPRWKEMAIHESSPNKRCASLKMLKQCSNYIPTHFFTDKPLGSMVGEYRNENLENQTFHSEIFDLVVSQDVMEHVFHPEKAFPEIARTLKKGGAYIFTVPLVNKEKASEVWAKEDLNGNVLFLQKPEYHGNPINPKGSPVTMHWGYDICDFIFRTSGLYTTIVYVDNIDLGIRAEYNEVLISRKF